MFVLRCSFKTLRVGELTLVKDEFSGRLVQVVPELVELCHLRSKVVKNDIDVVKVLVSPAEQILDQAEEQPLVLLLQKITNTVIISINRWRSASINPL